MIAFDAIVLAGGRSSRMGDVNKVGVTLGGRTLLAHACDAVADAGTLVVVGPDGLPGTPARAVVVREDPPFGGPAAALGAGLGVLDRDELVVVLAADVPGAAAAVPALLAAVGVDGVVARTSDGHRQPLVAVYRTSPLRAALGEFESLTDLGVNRVTRGMDLVELDLPDALLADVDTPADLERLKEQHE